jgi:hypothetical protein
MLLTMINEIRLIFPQEFEYFLNKIGETLLTSLKFDHFCKYPPNVQKFSLTPLNFQLLSIWTNPYKLGHNFFKKTKIPMIFI